MRRAWQGENIYLSNARTWLLDHLTPSLPVPTDDVFSRVFIESIALDQVVSTHSGNSPDRPGLVSSQAKLVDVYSQKVMSGADFRLRQLGSLLGVLVGSLIAGYPNMTWDPFCICSVSHAPMWEGIHWRHTDLLQVQREVLEYPVHPIPTESRIQLDHWIAITNSTSTSRFPQLQLRDVCRLPKITSRSKLHPLAPKTSTNRKIPYPDSSL
ncbi:uncharacterized protein TNCV_2829171 [Trichonephila clavipes]|nr:uncharacterized protein TNCV_2829171 [Trichonephila clavipes]